MKSQQPTLVFIHGWGFGPAVWQPVVDHLTTPVPVLTPALPGYDADTVQSPLDRLACLVEQEQEVVLVGWSMGGLLAIELAQRLPAKVRALHLIASLPCFNRGPDWPAGWQPAALAAVREQLDSDPQAAREYVAALAAYGDAEQRRVRRTLLDAPGASPAVMAEGLDYLAETDLRQAFRDLELPVRVWLGSDDALLGGDCAAAVQDLRPATAIDTLAGVGHAPVISRANLLAQDFLQENL